MKGCLIIILVVFVFFPLVFGIKTLQSIIRIILGRKRYGTRNNPQNEEKPASQDERIIEYKKKEFETSTAEDVEFEEIKEDEKK